MGGFFGISGFLITGSRVRSDFSPYIWRRILRIFPGLWVCLFIVAFVFVPIGALVEAGANHTNPGGIVKFLVANGALTNRDFGISGTLQHVPYPGVWDGSLWTLMYEFGFYLVVGALFASSRIRARPGALAALFVTCVLLTTAQQELGVDLPFEVASAALFGSYFFAGALLFVYADRLPVSGVVALASLVALALAAATDHVAALAALPPTFFVLWLGISLPLQRIGRRNDFSYGVYIYAFPIQQLLVLVGGNELGVLPYIVFAMLGTMPLAVASWFIVERPAMRLKRVPPPWQRRSLPTARNGASDRRRSSQQERVR